MGVFQNKPGRDQWKTLNYKKNITQTTGLTCLQWGPSSLEFALYLHHHTFKLPTAADVPIQSHHVLTLSTDCPPASPQVSLNESICESLCMCDNICCQVNNSFTAVRPQWKKTRLMLYAMFEERPMRWMNSNSRWFNCAAILYNRVYDAVGLYFTGK